VEPLKVLETESGSYSLVLVAGNTPVDELIVEAGHEPNGYFWEGVAQLVANDSHPPILEQIEFDSEAGMFCAYGADRRSLEALGALMAAVVNDPDCLSTALRMAEEQGFEFDD
jgi:hypothetical protein